MEDQYKRIVEVGGVKIEVDLRTAKKVDNFKVGDPVKVLKKSYGDTFNSYFGMIVGFDQFKTLPTIIVAYMDPSYGSNSPLKFEYINSASKDVEICASDSADLGIDKSDIIARLDNEIAKKEVEVAEVRKKKVYFLEHFGRYFG